MTDAQKKASKKYDEKFLKVTIRMTAEDKKLLEEKANKENKSINQYIIDIIKK